MLILCALACEKQPPPGAKDDAQGPERSEAPRAGTPILPRELAPTAPSALRPGGAPAAAVAAATPEAPYAGPWFAVTSPAAGVYSEMSFERNKKIGFMRSGGRTPVEPDKLDTCSHLSPVRDEREAHVGLPATGIDDADHLALPQR